MKLGAESLPSSFQDLPVVIVVGALYHDRMDADAGGIALGASLDPFLCLSQPGAIFAVNAPNLLFDSSWIPFGMQ